MKIKLLLTWLCVVGSSMGMSAYAERGLISARSSERNVTLPLETQFAVSAALGKDQMAYHVLPITPTSPTGERDGYQAVNPNQNFNARFDAQGACVASGGMYWNISVHAWGYGDLLPSELENIPTLREVGTTAPCVSANRVEYRRGALTEWYVNGPLGLQQGFTVMAPPTRNNGPGRAPLTLVLNLPAARLSSPKFGGGQAKVDADRTGLTLLTDNNEPALRYSGLTALDADGRQLPAWLETRNHELLLRVDDTGARYPLIIDPFIQQAKLTASDGAAWDNFGFSVALSSDGNTAIVGAYSTDVGGNVDQGAAYVFTRSGSSWSQQAKLTASDGAANDYFGRSVALSSDGDTAIAGADLADVDGKMNQGAAYVFTRSGSSWSQQTKLTAADGGAWDKFGFSVALSSDGNTAIASAVSENGNQGAAYVFTRSGSSWSQQAKLTAADGAANDYFGNFVALSSDGNTAIAGAYYADVGGNVHQGAAYVFAGGGTAIGPTIKANGATDNVTVNYPDTVSITVAMNADIYAGVDVDWWVVAWAHSGEWYYLNSAIEWRTLFSGNLADCQPVYQGPLFDLSSTPVLDSFQLPQGTYDFWFAVDSPMDGILDPNGLILYDKVTVIVQ